MFCNTCGFTHLLRLQLSPLSLCLWHPTPQRVVNPFDLLVISWVDLNHRHRPVRWACPLPAARLGSSFDPDLRLELRSRVLTTEGPKSGRQVPTELYLRNEQFCGRSWFRTSDLGIFSPTLYHLSYPSNIMGCRLKTRHLRQRHHQTLPISHPNTGCTPETPEQAPVNRHRPTLLQSLQAQGSAQRTG